MSEETVPKRQYTEEFRTEAVLPAESVGGHEAARRLGIPSATLSNWCRRQRKAPGKEALIAPLRSCIADVMSDFHRQR